MSREEMHTSLKAGCFGTRRVLGCVDIPKKSTRELTTIQFEEYANGLDSGQVSREIYILHYQGKLFMAISNILLFATLCISMLVIGGKVTMIKNGEYPRIPQAIRKIDDIFAVLLLASVCALVLFLLFYK